MHCLSAAVRAKVCDGDAGIAQIGKGARVLHAVLVQGDRSSAPMLPPLPAGQNIPLASEG